MNLVLLLPLVLASGSGIAPKAGVSTVDRAVLSSLPGMDTTDVGVFQRHLRAGGGAHPAAAEDSEPGLGSPDAAAGHPSSTVPDLVVDDRLWGTDGNVLSTVKSGNTIYIAGAFGAVGPSTGSAVPLRLDSGAIQGPYPRVAGYVYAVAPDGRGGWYIGGEFSAIGGLFRRNLAHVLPNGTVDDWDPAPNGRVDCILIDKQRVYAGGSFTMIGGQPRRHLAELDRRTARASNWDLRPNGSVSVVLLHKGSLFIGGAFDSIAGLPRGYLAAVDAKTGEVLDWRADASNKVFTLLVSGSTLYIGGEFAFIGLVRHPKLAAVNIETGQLIPSFFPNVDGLRSPVLDLPSVRGLAICDSTLYVGGWFSKIGGQERNAFAAVNARTGAATSLDLGLGAFALVDDVEISGDVVYFGGWFSGPAGVPRRHLAALNCKTGLMTDFHPLPTSEVMDIAIDGNTIYAGGVFTSVGNAVRRRCLAALDAVTGEVKPWNPNPVGLITSSIALHNGVLYAAGDFLDIGGQPRNCIGAVDTVSGAALPFRADLNTAGWGGRTLLVHENTLYVGGWFTSIAGALRNHLASVDLISGLVTDWNPNMEFMVETLAHDGSSLLVGGDFRQASGVARSNLAAFSLTDGSLLPWNPQANGVVGTMTVGNGVVYVGGAFDQVGGQPRSHLAALDLGSGAATPWDPSPDEEVQDIAVLGNTVFSGGFFTHIGGQPRAYLAGIDAVTGVATEWDPRTDDYVFGLDAIDGTLYVGGRFNSIGGTARSSFAAVREDNATGKRSKHPPRRPAARNDRFTLTAAAEALSSRVTLRFSLLDEGPVTLRIFDVQGRLVEIVLNHESRTAGEQAMSLSTDHLRRGLYFARLEAAGRSTGAKFVIAN